MYDVFQLKIKLTLNKTFGGSFIKFHGYVYKTYNSYLFYKSLKVHYSQFKIMFKSISVR